MGRTASSPVLSSIGQVASFTTAEAVQAGDVVCVGAAGTLVWAGDPKTLTGVFRPPFLTASSSGASTGISTSTLSNTEAFVNNSAAGTTASCLLSNGNTAVVYVDDTTANVNFRIVDVIGGAVAGPVTVGVGKAVVAGQVAVQAIAAGGFAIVYANSTGNTQLATYTNAGAVTSATATLRGAGAATNTGLSICQLSNNNLVTAWREDSVMYYAINTTAGGVVLAGTAVGGLAAIAAGQCKSVVVVPTTAGFIIFWVGANTTQCKMLPSSLAGALGAQVAFGATSSSGGQIDVCFLTGGNLAVVSAGGSGAAMYGSIVTPAGVIVIENASVDTGITAATGTNTIGIVPLTNGGAVILALQISAGVAPKVYKLSSTAVLLSSASIAITNTAVSNAQGCAIAGNGDSIGIILPIPGYWRFALVDGNSLVMVQNSLLDIPVLANSYHGLLRANPIGSSGGYVPTFTIIVSRAAQLGIYMTTRYGVTPTIIPVGVTLAAAGAAASVLVQYTGTLATRLPFVNPQTIDATRVGGQRMNVVGGIASLGVAATAARIIS